MATASSFQGSLIAPGRFNPPGTPAIYTAYDAETAYQEYQQGAPTPRPVVIVGMRVTLHKVIDFSKGYSSEWSRDWQDALQENWRLEIAAAEAVGRDPVISSWRCQNLAAESRVVAIKFPSQQRVGGMNLVLFPAQYVFGVDRHYDLDPHGDVALALQELSVRGGPPHATEVAS